MKFESLNELIISLVLWITSNTLYLDTSVSPEIEFVNQVKLADIACNKPCEIMAYTPKNSTKKIFMLDSLNPMDDVCHRGILLHEIIHLVQNEKKVYSDFDENTKKHMREMDALVNHNRFLSQYNKKILYSNGFAARLNTKGSKNDLYC